MFKTTTALIAAAIAATGVSALPAAAAGRNEGASVYVTHDDLDLTSEDGQTTLQRRLNRAAKQVCRYPTNRTLMTSQDEARCYRQARRDVAVQFAEVVSDRVGRGG